MRNGRIDRTHRAIRSDLRKLGWAVVDTHNLPGFVDMVALSPSGRVLLVEAKAKGGKHTAAQRKLLKDGWPVVTATCAEDVMKCSADDLPDQTGYYCET